MFRKNLFRAIFPHFSFESSESHLFLIMYMIRSRFFGPRELIKRIVFASTVCLRCPINLKRQFVAAFGVALACDWGLDSPRASETWKRIECETHNTWDVTSNWNAGIDLHLFRQAWRLPTSITPEMLVRAPHPENDPGVPCSMVREAAVLPK